MRVECQVSRALLRAERPAIIIRERRDGVARRGPKAYADSVTFEGSVSVIQDRGRVYLEGENPTAKAEGRNVEIQPIEET